MSILKKKLDSTPNQVYNIIKKDGEGFDLSSIPQGYKILKTWDSTGHLEPLSTTLEHAYKLVRETYEKDPSLFPTPPVFAGGFFRDIVWSNGWPSDLDLFFNSYGMTREEAEDNLCLFMSKMGVGFKEQDINQLTQEQYARLKIESKGNGPGTFRVFNLDTLSPRSRCNVQIILKDTGPPSDDPLYVVKDFHYNHSKAALGIVGDPCIHYHGHAVFGWEQSCHVQFRQGGMAKCLDKFYGEKGFKQLDLTVTATSAKPKSDVKMPNPCAEIKLGTYNYATYVEEAANLRAPFRDYHLGLNHVIQAQPVVNDPNMRPAGQGLVDIIRERNLQRNEFVNQFDPLRNNRRPLP